MKKIFPERFKGQVIVLTGAARGIGTVSYTHLIQILEDLGYFCVDNLPPKLIKTFIELCENTGAEIEKLALVTDIRGDIFSEAFQNSLINFKGGSRDIEMLFLEADDETLITRYQESRRKHPLTGIAGSLSESIKLEREKMSTFRQEADYVICLLYTSLSGRWAAGS